MNVGAFQNLVAAVFFFSKKDRGLKFGNLEKQASLVLSDVKSIIPFTGAVAPEWAPQTVLSELRSSEMRGHFEETDVVNTLLNLRNHPGMPSTV